jgi:glyoxylate/hydroxypyruvate reductase A
MPVTILFRPLFDHDTKFLLPALRETFADYDFRVDGQDAYEDEEIDYLIVWGLQKGEQERWRNLKAILSLSAGVNQYIGHPAFPSGRDVRLVRMMDPGLTASMVEYIAGQVLRLHREIDGLEHDAKAKSEWDYVVPVLAEQRSIGFLGLGALALPAIDALRPFGFQISGWSRSPKNIDGVRSYAGDDELAAFLRQTEILVCLLPLTDDTRDILMRTVWRLCRAAQRLSMWRGGSILLMKIWSPPLKAVISAAPFWMCAVKNLCRKIIHFGKMRIFTLPRILQA